MSDATKRAIRTAFHALIALPAVLALIPAGSPLAVKAAGFAAAIGAVSAVVNKLEDAGLIPAWLKDDAPAELSE